jgi:hypothetical protein
VEQHEIGIHETSQQAVRHFTILDHHTLYDLQPVLRNEYPQTIIHAKIQLSTVFFHNEAIQHVLRHVDEEHKQEQEQF